MNAQLLYNKPPIKENIDTVNLRLFEDCKLSEINYEIGTVNYYVHYYYNLLNIALSHKVLEKIAEVVYVDNDADLSFIDYLDEQIGKVEEAESISDIESITGGDAGTTDEEEDDLHIAFHFPETTLTIELPLPPLPTEEVAKANQEARRATEERQQAERDKEAAQKAYDNAQKEAEKASELTKAAEEAVKAAEEATAKAANDGYELGLTDTGKGIFTTIETLGNGLINALDALGIEHNGGTKDFNQEYATEKVNEAHQEAKEAVIEAIRNGADPKTAVDEAFETVLKGNDAIGGSSSLGPLNTYESNTGETEKEALTRMAEDYATALQAENEAKSALDAAREAEENARQSASDRQAELDAAKAELEAKEEAEREAEEARDALTGSDTEGSTTSGDSTSSESATNEETADDVSVCSDCDCDCDCDCDDCDDCGYDIGGSGCAASSDVFG